MEINEEGKLLLRIGKNKKKLAKLQHIERALPRLLEKELFSNQYSALCSVAMDHGTKGIRRLIRLINQAHTEADWHAVYSEFRYLAETEVNVYRSRKRKRELKLFTKPTIVAINRGFDEERGTRRT